MLNYSIFQLVIGLERIPINFQVYEYINKTNSEKSRNKPQGFPLKQKLTEHTMGYLQVIPGIQASDAVTAETLRVRLSSWEHKQPVEFSHEVTRKWSVHSSILLLFYGIQNPTSDTLFEGLKMTLELVLECKLLLLQRKPTAVKELLI